MIKSTRLIESSPFNFLDDPIINDYFKADDYLNYYYTLNANDRRNIAKEIISHNLSFLFSLDTKEIGSKVNKIIKDSNIGRINTDTSINNTAKVINSEGYILLAINKKLTKDYLTECYRNASKKYHPDVGGSNEKMQIINTTVGQFRNIIKMHFLDANDIEDDYMKVKSLNDFKFALAEQLFSICIDIFCLEKAIRIYNYLKENLLSFKKYNNYFLDTNSDNLDKLAVRLYKSGNTKQAEMILDALKNMCNTQVDRGLSQFYFDNIYNKCKNKLKGNEPARIIIRHTVQAQNAFRLNIIDKKKFDKLTKKYQDKKEIEHTAEDKLNEYILKHNFIIDLGIYEIPNGSPSKEYVPGLDTFYDRFEYLTMDQKIEYVNMFTHPVKLVLIRKYKKIRKISYLLSLIQNYNEFHSKEVIRECEILADILNDKSFLLIIEAHNYLMSIDSNERNKKLKLLNEMDYSTDPENIGMNSINLFELDFDQNKGMKRISVSEDYIEFMTASVQQLIEYKSTGKDPFITDQIIIDSKRVEDINYSDLYSTYREYVYGNEMDPYKKIEAILPYTIAKLELIPKIHPRSADRLWIGDAINNLTINYGKVKDWTNVKKWIEIFFNLPISHQNKSSRSELIALSKRLNRANNNLKK